MAQEHQGTGKEARCGINRLNKAGFLLAADQLSHGLKGRGAHDGS